MYICILSGDLWSLFHCATSSGSQETRLNTVVCKSPNSSTTESKEQMKVSSVSVVKVFSQKSVLEKYFDIQISLAFKLVNKKCLILIFNFNFRCLIKSCKYCIRDSLHCNYKVNFVLFFTLHKQNVLITLWLLFHTTVVTKYV